MDHVGQKRQRRASTQWTHQSQGHEVRREIQRRQNWIERVCEQFNSAGTFKHADRHEHCYQEWNDLQNHGKTFLRSLDKLIIDLDSAHGRVKGEKAEQEWNSEYRQRVYAPDKEIRFIIRAEVEPLRKYHSDKEKSETEQEQNGESPHPS